MIVRLSARKEDCFVNVEVIREGETFLRLETWT